MPYWKLLLLLLLFWLSSVGKTVTELERCVKWLKENDPSLTELLSLSYNSIGDDGAKEIALLAVLVNAVLTTLFYLGGKSIVVDHAKAIAEALLTVYTFLTAIDLSMLPLYLNGNSIGNEGTKAIIAEALKDNKVWISLFVKWNPIHDDNLLTKFEGLVNLKKNCIHKVNTDLTIEEITTIMPSMMMMMISLVNATGQEEGLMKLQNFVVNNDNNKLMIVKEGGITTVLSAMEEHPKIATVQEYGCSILGNLAVNYNKRATIAANKSLWRIWYQMRMILCSTLCLHSTSEIGCEYCPNKLQIAAEDVITTTNLTLTLASGEKQNTSILITFWQVN